MSLSRELRDSQAEAARGRQGVSSQSTAQAVTASTACNCLLDACAYCQALHAQRQALPAHTKCLRIF